MAEQQTSLSARPAHCTNVRSADPDRAQAHLTNDQNLGQTFPALASLADIFAGTLYRCEIAPPWKMHYVSGGTHALTGYPESEIKGKGWQHLIHPQDLPVVVASVDQAIKTKKPFSVTYRLIHRSGSLKRVLERGQATYDNKGNPEFLDGIISDVTAEYTLRHAQKAAKQEAQDYATKLAQVLESTNDCVISLDKNFRLAYFNRRATEEIRLEPRHLGKHVLSIYPELKQTPFWEAYNGVASNRESLHTETYMPGLNHWYEVEVAPTREGLTAFLRNIDDRKREELALRDREELFRRTVDHIPQMVWSTRADGYHDYYNRLWYEFTGVPKGTTDGEAWNDLFHPEDQDRAWEVWRNSLRTGEPYEIEYRLRHSDGTYRWVLGRAWPERAENGSIVRWYGTCTDIHDRVMAEEDLRESREIQQSVLDASADCIKIASPDGLLEYMNPPGLCSMELGSSDAIIGKDWVSLWPPEGQEEVENAINSARAGSTARFAGYCPTAKGTPRWWDVVVTPILSDQGEVTRLLGISRDITEQREATQMLKWASEHDSLTGLPNRRAFSNHLQAATLRAMSTGGCLTLLLIDLDHFKHVNDTLGHPAGDHLLKVSATRLRKLIRSTDFVARLGGDEFAIVIEDSRGPEDALEIGTAIVQRLRKPVRFDGRSLATGASVGGAMFPRDAENANELFKNADIALYALKDAGRGGTTLFHGSMRDEAQIVSTQLRTARVAITEDSIEPHYQQKVDLRTGQIIGFEALLRWRNSSGRLQLPGSVCEAFRDYELAAKIGDLMQRAVFKDMRAWLDQHIDTGIIAINAAPMEFLRDDFSERLLRHLDEYSIPSKLVELEITEHVFLGSGARSVARALDALHAKGIRIALDDFGTGHSSLSHIRDFPVDVVKIDRSFIDNMAVDQEVRSIVAAIINLSHSLQIQVVAEGVETEKQRQLLRSENCDMGQGFYFGKAVSLREVEAICAAEISCHRGPIISSLNS